MEEVKNALIAKIIDPSMTEEALIAALQVLNGKTEQTTVKAPRFLSEKDACEYAGGIAHSTLWHWRQRGLLSYQVGGRRLYRTTDLDKFILGEM